MGAYSLLDMNWFFEPQSLPIEELVGEGEPKQAYAKNCEINTAHIGFIRTSDHLWRPKASVSLKVSGRVFQCWWFGVRRKLCRQKPSWPCEPFGKLVK